ncbi:MAG: hypothetical protein E5W01_08720, partial [Mesorhizobium sp.]
LEPCRLSPHVINGGASVLVGHLYHIVRGAGMSRTQSLQADGSAISPRGGDVAEGDRGGR